tara:strand:- start:2062 stop:2781 length:720 start_codon:yes stop_codon:yes gene_type:complete
MRKAIYITLILGILISCKQRKESKQVENKLAEIPAWKIDLDTILERNNPKSLDLTKHQLFIDTTRNSENYEKVINWKPNRMDNDAISYYEKEISKKHKKKKVYLKGFPRYWISLKKLNNEFVIYEPCDGNTPSYEFNENSVLFYHQIETDADLVSELKKLRENEIALELNTIPQKTKSEKAELTIKPTEFKNVYELTYSFDKVVSKQFVTPKNNVSEFDIIVNNCPKMKRREFKGFDKD